MQQHDPIALIRENHHYCITHSCSERGCSLQLDGVDRASLTIINGTQYQNYNNSAEKLCDRIVFSRDRGFLLLAVELKGGRNIRASDAIKQIQNGLTVAESMLGNQTVAAWFPTLLFNGRLAQDDAQLLRTKQVRFRREPKVIIKRNCGTRLSAILPD